jgi:hypothetical protein
MVGAKDVGPLIIRLLFAAAMLIASYAEGSAKVYINGNYGFRVELPPGRVVCGPEYSTANHGFFVPFDTTDCLSDNGVMGIYVEASYNSMELRSTLDEGKLICDGAPAEPSPFWVSGYRFYQCESGGRNQHQSIKYFLLRRGKANDRGEEMTYDVGLICPHDDCHKLMPTARWIFAHMKFIRREQ